MICDEMTKLMVYVTMRDKSEMQRAGKCDTTKWEREKRRILSCPWKCRRSQEKQYFPSQTRSVTQRLKWENDKKKRLYDEIYRNQTGRKLEIPK